MKCLKIRAKVKAGIDLDTLGGGFNWTHYEPSKGVYWTNNVIVIYGNTRKVYYEKLTQEVLDCILELCVTGKLEIIKENKL